MVQHGSISFLKKSVHIVAGSNYDLSRHIRQANRIPRDRVGRYHPCLVERDHGTDKVLKRPIGPECLGIHHDVPGEKDIWGNLPRLKPP